MKQGELTLKAFEFARVKHRGQERKYTGLPYITHCVSVVGYLRQKTDDEEILAAGYLHDTLEDTETTYEELVENFGTRVAHLVSECTDEYTSFHYPLINRRERKLLEKERIALINPDAQLIKWADLTDNTCDICQNDPGFAVVYLREKADILEVILPYIKRFFKDDVSQQQSEVPDSRSTVSQSQSEVLSVPSASGERSDRIEEIGV